MGQDSLGNVDPIIDSVSDKARYLMIPLLEKSWNLIRILVVRVGESAGQNQALFVHGNMQLFPFSVLFFAMLLRVPFTLATDLQSCAVNDKACWARQWLDPAIANVNGLISSG